MMGSRIFSVPEMGSILVGIETICIIFGAKSRIGWRLSSFVSPAIQKWIPEPYLADRMLYASDIWSKRRDLCLEFGLLYIAAHAIYLIRLLGILCVGVRIDHTASIPHLIWISVFVIFLILYFCEFYRSHTKHFINDLRNFINL